MASEWFGSEICGMSVENERKGEEEMYTYNLTQWLAFFIIYCFIGWCWESSFVSVKKKKWVNRGFMHGPLLPIYGSGAVLILFVSLPFKAHPVAVYFAGMIAATILEYVTGVLMEALFKVRYWDYSNQKFNFQGHICLTSSLAWGFFSIAMVYWVHKPFEKFVLSIPEAVLSPIVHVVMMLAAADFALSFKTAIELRDVLVKVEAAKKELKLLQKRLEVVEAVIADEAQQRIEQAQQQKEEIKARIADETQLKKEQALVQREEIRERIEEIMQKGKDRSYLTKDKLQLLRRNPGATSGKYRLAFAEFRNETWPEFKAEVKEKIKEKLEEREEK